MSVKVTDLSEETTPADGDLVMIVDISAGQNKKVTRTNFFSNPPLGDGSVDPEDLVAGTGTSWEWQAWSPSLVNISVGNGTEIADYTQIGKTIHFRYSLSLGSTSTIGANSRVGLPVAATTNSVSGIRFINGGGGFKDATSGGSQAGGCATIDVNNVEPVYINTNGAWVAISSTAPFTWATGDELEFEGTIEAD